MDYSNYSISELKDSLNNIDKVAYPDNYQRLIEEMQSRKGEIEQFEQERSAEYIAKTENRLKILIWLQIANAIAFVYVGFTDFNSEQKMWVNLLPFGLAFFNGASGYLLLKKTRLGFNLSMINQVLQLAAVNLGFLYFSYSGLGSLMVIFQDGISLKGSLLTPAYAIYWGSDLGFGIGFDLIALFFLFVLSSCREDMDKWKS